jgi:(p)ppGpp synthase/HD superfamily hydrolase
VKLADRISNLQQPPDYWPRDKRQRYQEEAGQILDHLGEASPFLASRLAAKIEAYGEWID